MKKRRVRRGPGSANGFADAVRAYRESLVKYRQRVIERDRGVGAKDRSDQESLGTPRSEPSLDGAGSNGGQHPLTPRQLEVAILVRNGFSNAQIADELLLARGTVANHLQNIFSRLGLTNRSQLAVWVAEQGLVGD